jgi:hypothetical protein
MKICKLFFTLGLVAVMSVSAQAQTASATMNVTAELLQGLQIVSQVNLNPGKFVLTGAAGLTDNSFIITPNATSQGLSPVIGFVEEPTPGSFQVSGSPGASVIVKISSSVTLLHSTDATSEFTLETDAEVIGLGGFTDDNAGFITRTIFLDNSDGSSPAIYVGGTLGGIDQIDFAGSYSGTISINLEYQ